MLRYWDKSVSSPLLDGVPSAVIGPPLYYRVGNVCLHNYDHGVLFAHGDSPVTTAILIPAGCISCAETVISLARGRLEVLSVDFVWDDRGDPE